MLTTDLILDFTVDARSRVDRILVLAPEWNGFSVAIEDDTSSDKSAFEAHLAVGPKVWTRSKLEVILDGLGGRSRVGVDDVGVAKGIRKAGESLENGGDQLSHTGSMVERPAALD